MEPSNLIPFLRPNLDILFIGLNPARGSSRNRHYFSVNQAFWNQLYQSGLITAPVDKANADEIIFGSTEFNYKGWSYGITDLVTTVAESDSGKIKPSRSDCIHLEKTIHKYQPRTAVILHTKVLKYFLRFLGLPIPSVNSGLIDITLINCDTKFFSVAFPHGNAISSDKKVQRYQEIKQIILTTYQTR